MEFFTKEDRLEEWEKGGIRSSIEQAKLVWVAIRHQSEDVK